MRAPNLQAAKRARWMALAQRISLEQKLQIAAKTNYRPHPGQLEVHRDGSPFKVVCCGRRFGKSLLASFEAMCVALLGGWVMIVAPTYKNADIVFREALGMLLNSGYRSLITHVSRARGDQNINLSTGGRIFVRSSDNPSSLLGEGLDLVIFDEAAEEPDPMIWHETLRPTLWDRAGSFLAISTPEGDDWFKEMWDKGQTGVQGYKSWQMPSRVNPHLPEWRLRMEMADMPANVIQQEFFAIFLDSLGAVFRGFREVATLDPLDRPIPGRFYVLGVDFGKYGDWTVITVMDALSGDVVYVDRFKELEWKFQEQRVYEEALRWTSPVLTDATAQGGDRILESLQDKIQFVPVEGYVFTPLSKVALINQLKVDFEHQNIHLLSKDHPVGRVMLSEVGSFRYQKTDAGNITMSAPKGRHDDCVASLGLAREMARRYGGLGPAATPAGESEVSKRLISGTFTQTSKDIGTASKTNRRRFNPLRGR